MAFTPSSLPSPDDGTNGSDKLSLLYYGIIMIGLTSLLVVYKFVVVEWCRPLRSPVQRLRQSSSELQLENVTTSQSFDENSCTQLISTYMYEKSDKNKEEDSFNNECVVCLSTFDDGQDVRQLSRCKHSFHGPCIDMWLYSHPDCPICRW
ncbi:hypothetical protein MKW94_009661 [Papaver nudicaule]|uniref:RING-type domain-containing protein n=1 Tax=Papaver nudicaule TaxID=74823 RepID=A0AA41UXA3_PAPNU|nr:hypothetical protein [Papaver nudicaule]